MVAKLLFKLMTAFKMSCLNNVSAKPPSLQQARDQQEAKSEQQTSEVSRRRALKQKIGSAVAGFECFTFSGTSPAGKKLLISGEALEAPDLQPRLAAHYGIPATACTMAFDPVQNLFATATRDGRIKIFGDACMEVLLQSPKHAPCHFLQFMHNQSQIVNITTMNDIEVWDLGTKSLAACYKWAAEITAFAVVQGSPFMYVGDETGILQVLQYDVEKAQLHLLPYSVPINLTLGEAIKSFHIPPVISILPQPQGEFERVLIAYGNGLVVLWQLQDGQVLAVRGGSSSQVNVSSENPKCTLAGSLHEKEDKELSCVCWTCPNGSSFAAGYTDGDVWLWSVPPMSKPKGLSENQGSGFGYSSNPTVKIQICSSTTRMPIFMLKWWPLTSNETKQGKGGHLCVFGGGEFGRPEVLKLIPLKDIDGSKPRHCLELPLHGPLADFVAVPSSGSFPITPAAILILISPGFLHAYDAAKISDLITNSTEGRSLSLPEPVSIKLPVAESCVTVGKLFLIQSTGKTADDLLQIPRVLKSVFPTTMWPFIGKKPIGTLASAQSKGGYIYITGHDNGFVNIWDISTPPIYSVCSLESQKKLENLGKQASPVTALDFCTASGFLAVGNKNGVILLYELANELGEVKDSSTKKGGGLHTASFHFVTNFDAHQAPISSMVISAAQERLAAGCESGTVSLINLKTCCLLYRGKCFASSSEIISLRFANIPLFTPGFSIPLSPAAPYLKKRESTPLTTQAAVLVVTTKDASMMVLNGENGVCHSGPFQPRHPSIALSLYLLDASGAPFADTPGLKTQMPSETLNTSESMLKNTSGQMLKSTGNGSIDSSKKLNNGRKKDNGEEKSFESAITEGSVQSISSVSGSSQLLVLLCSEDCLRLYYLSSVMQGVRSPRLKSKLQKVCCWTSIFETPSNGSGLILLYKTGELEFRSLPDMTILKETSMSTCLHWHIKPDLSLLRTISCTTNGQTALIDDDKELIFLSLLDEKHDSRVPASLPHFHGKDTPGVSEGVPPAVSHTHKKKGLLVGVIKEIKGGVKKSSPGVGEITAVHRLSELAKILGAGDFVTARFSQSCDGSHSDSSNSTETRTRELDIDDIDLEDKNNPKQALPSKPSHGHSLVRKVKGVLKAQKRDPKHDTATAEVRDYESSGEGRVRTLNEIKYSYGHQKAMDASTTAAHARDKLLQRGEKLQEINKRTAEMQNDAENFHNLTEELVKTLEKRKWGF